MRIPAAAYNGFFRIAGGVDPAGIIYLCCFSAI